MKAQEQTDYNRIAAAIGYIRQHFKEQPVLEEIAENVHVSPFHFQRLFTEWAGVSPKKFLQYITVEHARKMLAEGKASLFDAALESGLSGTGRLHDLFVNIEGMTPGEYKNGGEALTIHYGFGTTAFGNVLVASTSRGICHVAFYEAEETAVSILKAKLPNARYIQQVLPAHEAVLSFFTDDQSKLSQVKLHLKGTDFQLKVWEALLKIPAGQLSTYGNLASYIERPGASRAVGSAIGDNPVAFLIPCHRVIQSTGNFGQYMWGADRKTAIIGWEAAATDKQHLVL